MVSTFSPTTPVAYRGVMIELPEDRCGIRHEVEIPTRLRWSGRASVAMTVLDISTSGARCALPCQVPVGTRCWLALPGIEPRAAELVWNNGREMGLAFQNLMSEFVVEMLVRRYHPVSA